MCGPKKKGNKNAQKRTEVLKYIAPNASVNARRRGRPAKRALQWQGDLSWADGGRKKHDKKAAEEAEITYLLNTTTMIKVT